MRAPRWIAVLSAAALAALLFPFLREDPAAARVSGLAASRNFAVENVRVFDGERVLPVANVVVRDGLIHAVGESVAIPKELPVVDGAGKTLLPGLIDAHVHSWGESRREALRFGVTTELDMFSDWHQLEAARKARESRERSELADLWSAGTLVTAAGGHGTQFGLAIPTISMTEEATGFVAARVAEGSDFIKIVLEDGVAHGRPTPLPTLDAATLGAVVDAAQAQSRLAVVHVGTERGARSAMAAGADGLVHLFGDRVADEATIAAIRARNAFVVPTLSILASLGGAGRGAALTEDARIAPYLLPGQRTMLTHAMPLNWRKPELLANARQSVRRLRDAGIDILAGTDAGNPGIAHGASLHDELALLVEAGLTPVEALAAATAVPAVRFGLADRGRIVEGLRADLLLVEGDPTVDITATRAIAQVWKNGHRIARAASTGLDAPRGSKPDGDASMLSRFDDGELDAAVGSGWMPTSDLMAGGASRAELRVVEGGAEGSGGAMEVHGVIAAGAPRKWAGAMYLFGRQPMMPVDLGDRTELVFWVRGDERPYAVLLFSGEGMQTPSARPIEVGPDWTQVRLPLAEFAGLDASRLRALSISAGDPDGEFALQIDQVEIR